MTETDAKQSDDIYSFSLWGSSHKSLPFLFLPLLLEKVLRIIFLRHKKQSSTVSLVIPQGNEMLNLRNAP